VLFDIFKAEKIIFVKNGESFVAVGKFAYLCSVLKTLLYAFL